MKRIALPLALFSFIFFSNADAHAGEFSLSVGQDLAAVDIVGARSVTNIGTRIGYRFGRIHPFVTGDYARYSTRTEYETRDFSDVGATGALLTLGIGSRYLFGEPEADRAVPYVVGTGLTVLPTFDAEDQVPKPVSESTAFGFLGGFGVDYFVGEAFSIGGEVGFNGIFASYTDATSTWRGSVVQLYSGFELTFYF